RREWLACFDRVLERAPERYAFPTEHLPGFRRFLRDFSLWMVNTDDGTGDLVDEAGGRRPDPTASGEAAGGALPGRGGRRRPGEGPGEAGGGAPPPPEEATR